MAFSTKSLDFLAENQFQNSKAWYEAHKTQYQEDVVTPLLELVAELTPTMLTIDNTFLYEPKIGKTVSRIYRDVRFSHDKSLYRERMWLLFMREKKLYHGLPSYFFQISPQGFMYGCGYYLASTQSMDRIRNLIVEKDKLFKKAISAYEKQDIFTMDGDCYKRSKYPDQSERMKNWLDRKSLCFIKRSDDLELLFSERLADQLAEDYLKIAPIYQFLIKAETAR